MVSTSAHEFRQLVKKNYAELQVKSPKLPLNLIRIIAVEQAIAVALDAHLLDPEDPHPQYTTSDELSAAIAAAVSTASNALTAHVNAADPHTQYIDATELAQAIAKITLQSLGAAPVTHTHTPASIGAAAAVHTHTPESIGAAPTNHTHPASAITDLNAAIDARLVGGTASRVALLGYEQLIGPTKPTTRANGTALVNGDRWYSTTDNLEFFWNSSLSVWMSRLQTAAGPGVGVALLAIKSSGFNIYVEEFSFAGRTGLVNNAAANIQVVLERVSTTADVVLATLNTGAIAANARFSLSTTLNLLLNVSTLNLTSLRTVTNVILNGSTLTSQITQISYRWVKP